MKLYCNVVEKTLSINISSKMFLFNLSSGNVLPTGRWAIEASTVYNHKCLYEDTNVFAASQ